MNTMINLQNWFETLSFKDNHNDQWVVIKLLQHCMDDHWVVVLGITMDICCLVIDHKLLQQCLYKTKLWPPTIVAP